MYPMLVELARLVPVIVVDPKGAAERRFFELRARIENTDYIESPVIAAVVVSPNRRAQRNLVADLPSILLGQRAADECSGPRAVHGGNLRGRDVQLRIEDGELVHVGGKGGDGVFRILKVTAEEADVRDLLNALDGQHSVQKA